MGNPGNREQLNKLIIAQILNSRPGTQFQVEGESYQLISLTGGGDQLLVRVLSDRIADREMAPSLYQAVQEAEEDVRIIPFEAEITEKE